MKVGDLVQWRKHGAIGLIVDIQLHRDGNMRCFKVLIGVDAIEIDGASEWRWEVLNESR